MEESKFSSWTQRKLRRTFQIQTVLTCEPMDSWIRAASNITLTDFEQRVFTIYTI